MIIGVDVGGTFTDLVGVDEDGHVAFQKVPSQPQNEGQAVLHGLARLGVSPSAVERLVHGTTVGTNAIIQRRGARTAFVTTYGFRDILEIGRARRMIPATLFKPFFVRPKPVVPRSRCFEVKERVLHDGQVLHPVADDDVARLCDKLRDAGVEAVAVCFLHSYANPANEERVAEFIASHLDGIPVSLSSRVVPEYREFERFSTTVLNAYIQPLMQQYLYGLERTLVESGYHTGVLTVASSGGIMTLDTAVRFPVRSILSGPAAGVVQSVFLAQQLGLPNVITCDMGGTSTDVCLIRSYLPTLSTEDLVEGFPIKIPQVDINAVGAGGGSIAWVDVDGALQVGPQSAGASPGPACYGLGGTEPTVTDANVLLGRLSPTRVLGGSIRLRPDLAEQAFRDLAARYADLSPHELAEGVIRLAVARMSRAIREVSVQRGHDPREFVLIPYGGAGPMHACQVADELEMPKVVVPRLPGNLSALGLVNCDLKHDYVRTHICVFSKLSVADLAQGLAALEQEAERQLRQEGIRPDAMVFQPSLDVRYYRQAFELGVPVDTRRLSLEDIARDFHQRHQQTFGHSDPSAELELVNLRLTALGLVQKVNLPQFQSPSASLAEAELERRPVFFLGAFQECPVYDRDLLPVSLPFAGPAIVEEASATTVVPPGWRALVDTLGNLVLERQS